MKSILIIGAGRSASFLIQYLLENAVHYNWEITVADLSLELANSKINAHKKAKGIALNIDNEVERKKTITAVDVVVSMLPAHMHVDVAKDCLELKKHLVTASYVSKEMKALDAEAKKQGVLFLNEMGLDPGIDHMSAMKIIDEIKSNGGELLEFYSYCGGLVAPEYNDNPWGYKFTWNPRNVVLAGQGTAQYIEKNELKYIPYNRLFKQIKTIEVDGYGAFEAYANRDSLSYRKSYGIEQVSTMLRGTLRMSGYCSAWDIFVQLGITDDSYKIENCNGLTYRQWIEAYLPGNKQESTKKRLAEFLGVKESSEIINKLEWLDILSDKKIDLSNASPAEILQNLLEKKWKLQPQDKDMIVMQHQFLYKTNTNKVKKIISSLVTIGQDQTYTAMAKTVGLPVAIATKLILLDQLKLTGVHIPVQPIVYNPILKELEENGIVFSEKEFDNI